MKEVRVIERHPIRHDWYLHGDYVYERNASNRIIVIKRIMHCQDCPTELVIRIDVTQWTRVGSPYYRYAANTLIQRMSKNEFLKKEFLATTTLTTKEKKELARA